MTTNIKMKINKQNLGGFMMLEAIFSAFITMLVVLILQAIIKNICLSSKLTEPTAELAYSYVQLDRFFHQKGQEFSLLPERSTSQKAVILCKSKTEKKIYLLTKYHDMLRLSTIYSGHMPLLLHVEQAKFATSKNTLKIFVTEKDQRQSELCFHFQTPKKEVKDHGKEQTKKAKATSKKAN